MEKKLYFFKSKIAIFLSLGLFTGCPLSKLQEKPSTLKREHPALQKIKFNTGNFFQFLWVIFALLDPTESGSATLDVVRVSSSSFTTIFRLEAGTDPDANLKNCC
jgi:hypothetical protein